MELIKRKILLEDSIDRSYNSKIWGKLTADTFFINVLITQNIDDMGLFTDIEYFSASTDGSNQPNYSILVQKLIQSGITFPFMFENTPYLENTLTIFEEKTIRKPFSLEPDFYNYLDLRISGYTDSKIDDVYKIAKKPLGTGAYGVVSLCVHKQTKQERAVKKVAKKKIKNMERFEQEIKILQMLDHPNILKLYEYFEDEKNVYLVTEICKGGELFDRIIENEFFSEPVAARIFK